MNFEIKSTFLINPSSGFFKIGVKIISEMSWQVAWLNLLKCWLGSTLNVNMTQHKFFLCHNFLIRRNVRRQDSFWQKTSPFLFFANFICLKWKETS